MRTVDFAGVALRSSLSPENTSNALSGSSTSGAARVFRRTRPPRSHFNVVTPRMPVIHGGSVRQSWHRKRAMPVVTASRCQYRTTWSQGAEITLFFLGVITVFAQPFWQRRSTGLCPCPVPPTAVACNPILEICLRNYEHQAGGPSDCIAQG